MAVEKQRTPRPSLEAGLDRAHGLVLLAPAAFLVWPGPQAPLQDDPGESSFKRARFGAA